MPVDTSALPRLAGAVISGDPANALRSAAAVTVMNHSHTINHLSSAHNGLSSLSAEERARNETVEGKWEQLQHYEERWQHQQDSIGTTASTTSSSSSTSSSAGSVDPGNNRNSGQNAARNSKFQQIKRHSIKKLANLKSLLTRSSRHQGHTDYGAVSTAPDGSGGGTDGNGQCGVIPRIRASKSMQNLEQITRDGYYNLREMKSSLKERYNSRQELRQARPTSYYAEFWDEYDPDATGAADPNIDEETFNNITKYHQKNRVLDLIGLH